jgi:hypothetical protein
VTWVMWNLVSVRLEIALVLVQDRCMVCTKDTISSEIVWTHPMVLQGNGLKWKLDSVCLEIVLILSKIGGRLALNIPQAHKSFWTHMMELLGDVGHVESCFGPFGDSICVGAR